MSNRDFAAAEASLTELGLAPDRTAFVSPTGRTHPLMNVARVATDTGVLSQREVDASVRESVDLDDQIQMRKAALKLAGESDAVADALATSDTLPGELVNRMHDAIRPLRARVEQDLERAQTFAEAGPETDSVAGAAHRQVRALKQTLRTLNELAAMSELTPSTLADKLAAVEELRVSVGAEQRRVDEARAQRAAAEREADA